MIISSPKNLSLSLTTNKHWIVPCFPSIQIYFLLNTHFTCSAHLKHPFFFISQETRLPFIKGNLKTHILRNNYHVQTLNVFSVFILFINCCHRIVKSCLTFCDPMDCNIPGFLAFTISGSLLNLISVELVMASTILSLIAPFSSCPQSFSASGSFPMSQFFASGGQSIGVSASTSVLPMNTQD